MAKEMFGDEYEAEWEQGTPNKCPKCGNRGRYSKGENRILEASPPVRDENGNILKIHIDPPLRWEDGRRHYVCCKCGHIGHAIEFKKLSE